MVPDNYVSRLLYKMIIKSQLDKSLLHLMKQVNEEALRQCKVDGMESISELLQECFDFKLWSHIHFAHIIKVPNNSSVYKFLHHLRFNPCIKGKSDYVIAVGSFNDWKNFCIDFLSQPFDENFTLGFYLQVDSIYLELYELHPTIFKPFYMKQVTETVFILEKR